MSIGEINALSKPEKKELLLTCCFSTVWVEKMLTVFPVRNGVDLNQQAKEKWSELNTLDWQQAFKLYPPYTLDILKERFLASNDSASNGGINASEAVLHAILKGNNEYAAKFGFNFIILEKGKPAIEILNILQTRLMNTADEEIKLSAQEYFKIALYNLNNLFE